MAKQPNELLLDWSRTGFENLDREQLKQAADLLGVEIDSKLNSKHIRNRLRNAIGYVDSTMPEDTVEEIGEATPAKHDIRLNQAPPNLTASGRWGGRYRRVRLLRTDFYKTFTAFPIGWEGAIRYYHFDTELDMAWPYYASLKSMVQVTLVQTITPDGRQNLTNEQQGPVVPFSDMGDVPGTEHLPRSMTEYVRWLVQANDNLADAPRRDLIRVMRWLHGASINARLRDLADDDIRDQILTFVGVDLYETA